METYVFTAFVLFKINDYTLCFKDICFNIFSTLPFNTRNMNLEYLMM